MKHGRSDTYYFHSYGFLKNKPMFIGGGEKNVRMTAAEPEPAAPVLTVTASANGETITCRLTNAPRYSQVKFPVWTAENGQDDLKWYNAAKNAAGIWTYTFNPANHKPGTTLNIHVYGYLNGKNTFIGNTLYFK